mmetsp:Transcript_116733/g.326546  ORF Transcript_116733/g.326546 Transcript_116733/m.326546 type:complete len:220 (+) Transcript_116733:101-760(+)
MTVAPKRVAQELVAPSEARAAKALGRAAFRHGCAAGGELGSRSVACVTHRLDDVADHTEARCRGGTDDLAFSYEEALECCKWMTPDLLARLALRRSLAADDGLAETEARSTEGGSSSGAESEAGDDRKFDAALDTYEEAPPSELNSFVSRLMGLEAVEVQDDGLGEDEAYEWRSAQEALSPDSAAALLGRLPPPGLGVLCTSSHQEFCAKYSLRPQRRE